MTRSEGVSDSRSTFISSSERDSSLFTLVGIAGEGGTRRKEHEKGSILALLTPLHTQMSSGLDKVAHNMVQGRRYPDGASGDSLDVETA